ncbi:MAG: hypothetical protein COY66_04550 [Candidatus Kerfeldbacteria bacterium CG_4_10_14_0_8_um_filter_42_10]|uniref:Uncharacterized protein n=1 Tax=Candidatus Kerfeldbacteria bacterium CG_4_10_14_0_8_um_filter_42_10 TaxID=2014248 RepID=A0A2M7RHR1_9BACT|nr:MAG: hypothetical protein COY66_04550 [Candidatus Kerfeldbacteria bacterium CG_4_10_14_0_8_um_filter_42_10]
MPKNNVSETEIKEEAKALGRKIVLLLQASDLPEDVQLAIIELLPEMTLDQIDELVNLLSQNVARQGQGEEELKNKLAAIKQKYDAKKSQLADSVMKDLDSLEKEIE